MLEFGSTSAAYKETTIGRLSWPARLTVKTTTPTIYQPNLVSGRHRLQFGNERPKLGVLIVKCLLHFKSNRKSSTSRSCLSGLTSNSTSTSEGPGEVHRSS